MPFMVCPGTSSWLSLVGPRAERARERARRGAHRARARRARACCSPTGAIRGTCSRPSMSLPALLCAAALAWATDRQARARSRSPRSTRWSCAIATGTIGAALARLGGLYAQHGHSRAELEPARDGAAAALQALRADLGPRRTARGSTRSSPRSSARAPSCARAKPQGFGGALVARELAQAAALARHGAFRLMHACLGEGPSPDAACATSSAPLIEEQRACWLARSRPGGLADSLAPARARARGVRRVKRHPARAPRRAEHRAVAAVAAPGAARVHASSPRDGSARSAAWARRGATRSACSRSATCRATSSSCSASRYYLCDVRQNEDVRFFVAYLALHEAASAPRAADLQGRVALVALRVALREVGDRELDRQGRREAREVEDGCDV